MKYRRNGDKKDEEGKGPGHVSADLMVSGKRVAVVDGGGLGGGSNCPAIVRGSPVALLDSGMEWVDKTQVLGALLKPCWALG